MKQRILRSYIDISGLFTILLGILVMIGWYSHYLPLIQLRPTFAPMQFNTALGFLLAGVAMLTIDTNKKVCSIVVLTLIAISGLTISQQLIDINWGIDEFFIKSYLPTIPEHPGRMAPNTMVSLFLSGIAFWLLLSKNFIRFNFLALLAAYTVTTLAIIGVVSYTTHFTIHYSHGKAIRMALHTSIGLLILGIGLISQITLKKPQQDKPTLMPLVVSFLILFITFLGWQEIKRSQDDYLSKLVDEEIINISDIFQLYIQERANAFVRITGRWINRPNTPADEWRADIRQYLHDQPGYRAIEWEDKSYQIRWVEPEIGNEQVMGMNLYDETRKRTLSQAEAYQLQTLRVSGQIDLVQGGKGILFLNPIFKTTGFDGFMVGVIDTQVMLEKIIPSSITAKYALKIEDNGKQLYASAEQKNILYDDWNRSTTIPVYGRTWKIVIWPTTALYDSVNTSWFPAVIIIAGLFLACIAGFLASALQLLRINSHKLEHARRHAADMNSKLNGIIDGSTDLIAAIDTRENFIAFNTSFMQEMWKLLHIDVVLHKNLDEVFHPLNAALFSNIKTSWQKALTGLSFKNIETFTDQIGVKHIYEVHYSPILSANNELIGASQILINMTERVTNEKNMLELQDELQLNLKNLDNQNKELGLLRELISLLQASITLESMIDPIVLYTNKLLKQTGGEIYIKDDDDHNLFKKLLAWGGPGCPQMGIAKADCWALLQNKMHLAIDQNEMIWCNHVNMHAKKPDAAICIPLDTQDGILGIMYVEIPQRLAHNNRLHYLAQILAEQIALSFYNTKLRHRLEYQSIHDPLTGLYNRRFFEENFKKNLFTAERSHDKFFIFIIDIDHFKHINDTYGHLAGDVVIQTVAKQLNRLCRSNDTLCRWGGEEFLIFFGMGSLEAAKTRAEEIRTAIEALAISTEGKILPHLTISMGIAAYPADGTDLNSLTANADAALYQAKNTGRNKVIFRTV